MRYITFFIALFFSLALVGQNTSLFADKIFSRKDTLRGTLSTLRSCYDVTYYRLFIDVDPVSETIKGNNKIYFKALANFTTFQLDLNDKLVIDSIVYNDQKISYTREFDAVFVTLPNAVNKGTITNVEVYYHGKPIIAKQPPWDGGLVFSKDAEGKPFLGVACEGIGASIWYPCKDHLSDEPDSISVTGVAPKGLSFVSNGKLQAILELPDGKQLFNWFCANPINNYNVTFYIGNFTEIRDEYKSPITGKKLDLSYYVLPYNVAKAEKHFNQVKPMLKCFEEMMGPYPFYKDGYKLVEAPYLGMEHQSAIAYGNNYQKGYAGQDYSGMGLNFDFIIIHETGHEWWGNNVTMADMADMWISEAFCTYSEVLYVECIYGKKEALTYINNKKPMVQNDRPMRGYLGVNHEGSGDMYAKGALMLHTIRSVINNDEVFMKIIKGMQKEFALKQIGYTDVIDYFTKQSGMNLEPVFNQYLNFINRPTLQYKVAEENGQVKLFYKWKANAPNFAMPIEFSLEGKDYRVDATSEWNSIPIKPKEANLVLNVNFKRFYIDVEAGAAN